MQTTLNKIRQLSPCASGWAKLLKHLGKTRADDEPLAIRTILDSNGLDDAVWCLAAVEGYDPEIRLYAVWCARQTQHLMTDPRSLAALDVAERYAKGLATDDERAAARNAAEAAVRDATSGSAELASAAAEAATRAAIRNAARNATRAAAWAAAWGSAMTTASAAQEKRLREVLEEIESANDLC